MAQPGALYTYENDYQPVTIAWPPSDLGADAPPMRIGIKTVPGDFAPGEGPGWVVKVVDMDGTALATLDHANIESVRQTLNDADEVTFSSPKHDPGTAEVALLGREVQVWRQDDLKSWAVPVTMGADSGDGKVSFAAKGLWWYFTRRVLGQVNYQNRAVNGDFESGLAAWAQVGSLSPSVVSTPTVHGGHSLRLDASSSGDNYVAQRFAWDEAWWPYNTMWASAWVYIASIAQPAAMGLGLYLHCEVDGNVISGQSAGVDTSLALNQWVRLDVGVNVPTGASVIEARLYAPQGTVYWDDVRVYQKDVVGSVQGGTDSATMASWVIAYLQDPAKGKSDLNIKTHTPPSGKLFVGGWDAAHHDAGNVPIETLSQLTPGFDYGIEITPATRVFTTYSPHRGTDRSATVTLKLGAPSAGGNLVSYSLNSDSTGMATSAIMLGDNEGDVKEEGGYVDATGVDGLVLEQVETAPQGTPVGDLDPLAERYVEVNKVAASSLTVVTHDGATSLIDLLGVGDIVTVAIDDGVVQIDTTYRIVQRTIKPSNDTMELVLNTWSAP